MIDNYTCISKGFTDRVTQTAFVYWYVGEFSEAREDLGFLERNHLDVLAEQSTGKEDGNDDDGGDNDDY